jgi:hypothetical protein
MTRNTSRQGQQKGQGRRVRLGTGDYVPAGAANGFARVAYLQAVSRCVPEAMAPLRTIEQDDETQLIAWAEQWGFTDEWALSSVRRHLPFWHAEPDNLGRWVIFTVVSWEPSYGQDILLPNGVNATLFPFLTWNPIAETEASFRARVDEYIEAMKASPGMEQTPKKVDVDRHFEWLALHHVARCSYNAIAERYQTADLSSDISTISRAITTCAALIGLTLRPSRGRKLQASQAR